MTNVRVFNLAIAIAAAFVANATSIVPCASQPPARAGKVKAPAAGKAKVAVKAPAAVSVPGAVKKVTVIRQRSNMLGATDLYLGDNCACISIHDGNIKAFCLPPDYKVMLYSKSKNLAYTIENSSAADGHMDALKSPIDIARGVASSGHNALLRVDCTRVRIDGSKMKVVEEDPMIYRDRQNKTIKEVTLEVANVGPIMKPLQIFLNWMYDQKSYPGVPINLDVSYSDGSKVNIFSTQTITKGTKEAAFFTYPTGYKSTTSKTAVVVSDDMNSTLEDLIGPGR